MAYDEYMVERIQRILNEKKIKYDTTSMMGGVMFSMDDKMLCATSIKKKLDMSLLMCRVGEEVASVEMEKEEVIPMDATGKKMKDFIYVKPDGVDADDDLEYFIQLCIEFNPQAKRSKKKKK